MRADRNAAIDTLRGLVMILMALDHTRAFVGSPVHLATAPPALFFTRWITHFCAPVFVLLAGTAAFLHGRRLGSPVALARFLASRGLWLIVLEVTVVRFAWTFRVAPAVGILQVIWAIGAAMVVLAALVWLPRRVIAAVALLILGAEDLLDGIRADDLGGWRAAWLLAFRPGSVAPFEGARWFVAYPFVPWTAIMAAGYALGPTMLRPQAERRRLVIGLGAAVAAGFVVLRASGFYGDPEPWTPARGALAFLDCEKYPPSLLFAAMTLGPALVVLGLLDRPLGAWSARVAVFGRVPLFYYVLHLYLVHAMAVALAWPALGAAAFGHAFVPEGGLGYSLPIVYALWLAVVSVLYPPSEWFAGVKRRSDAAWLSYL